MNSECSIYVPLEKADIGKEIIKLEKELKGIENAIAKIQKQMQPEHISKIPENIRKKNR